MVCSMRVFVPRIRPSRADRDAFREKCPKSGSATTERRLGPAPTLSRRSPQERNGVRQKLRNPNRHHARIFFRTYRRVDSMGSEESAMARSRRQSATREGDPRAPGRSTRGAAFAPAPSICAGIETPRRVLAPGRAANALHFRSGGQRTSPPVRADISSPRPPRDSLRGHLDVDRLRPAISASRQGFVARHHEYVPRHRTSTDGGLSVLRPPSAAR
jgi:hypothetical protein